MTVREEWIGSNEPATKGDLATLHEDMHAEMQQLATKNDLKRFATKEDLERFATKEDLNTVKNTVEETRETMKTVLEIVKDIDKHNKTNANIPERVRKLEDDVLRLKLKR